MKWIHSSGGEMDTKEIELMLMRAWPALEEKIFDGWVLRFSKGYTKRSNCINPVFESYFDLEEKYDYCQKLYNNKGLKIIYKIIEDDASLEVDEFLSQKGLLKKDVVTVKEIDLYSLSCSLKDVSVNWGFSEEWFEFFSKENKLDEREKIVLKELLNKNDKNSCYVYKEKDGEIIAGALGVIENDKLGIFNVYVKEVFRKKGYAMAVLEALLVEARKINVKKAYLQVMETNNKAFNLYRKMGFVPKYKTWYRY